MEYYHPLFTNGIADEVVQSPHRVRGIGTNTVSQGPSYQPFAGTGPGRRARHTIERQPYGPMRGRPLH